MKAIDRLDRLRFVYMTSSGSARQAESLAVEIDQAVAEAPHDLRKLVYPATHRLREAAKRLRLQALRADKAMRVILKKRPDLIAAARSAET